MSVEVGIAAGKAFNLKAITQVRSLEVGKAGLPPLFGGPDTIFVQSLQ